MENLNKQDATPTPTPAPAGLPDSKPSTSLKRTQPQFVNQVGLPGGSSSVKKQVESSTPFFI